MRIYDLLPIGKEKKISRDDLLQRTGYRSIRALQEGIRAEREAGYLILSAKDCGGGYYRPGNTAEIRDFIERYEDEARSIFSMLKSARRELQRKEDAESGQVRMTFET